MHGAIEYVATDFETAMAFLAGVYDPGLKAEDIEGADFIDRENSLTGYEDLIPESMRTSGSGRYTAENYKSVLLPLFKMVETGLPGIVKLVPKEADVHERIALVSEAANKKIAELCEKCGTEDPYSAVFKLEDGREKEILLNQMEIMAKIEGEYGEPVVCLMHDGGYTALQGLSSVFDRLSGEKAIYAVTGKYGSYHY